MHGGEVGPDAPTLIERVDVPMRASESTPGSDAQLRAHLLAGARVGRFRIVDALGEGGMSLVFAAHDDELDHPVALKILRTQQSDGPSRARLLREAQALARLSHPNVVTIYEVGVWSGCVFAAMELIPGMTLREWLRVRKPSRAEVVAVMIEAGRGHAAAHAAGIVHRDFKPTNVLVGSDGRTRVLDFGLAVARGERDTGAHESVPLPRSREPSGAVNLLGETLTIAGTISGTPAYMAPEQLRGGVADVSADVYAFGATLFEALLGRRPSAGRTLRERRAELDRPPSLDFGGAKLPARLRALLTRCLALDPRERYPSMQVLLADLEPGRPTTRRRVALAAALLLVTLGLGYGYGYGLGPALPVEPRDACAALAGGLDAAWSEARRRELEASLSRSRVAHAEVIAARVTHELDARASELAAARVAACQAGVRGELDELRLDALSLCLDARARAFDRFVTALEGGSPAVVERALPALVGLERVSSCSAPDRQALRDGVADEPGLREQALRLADTLDDASLAVGLGQVDEALELTRSLVTRAHELGWHALEAEAALLQGRAALELAGLGSRDSRDSRDMAAHAFERALWRADRIHDDRTLAGALTGLLALAAARDDADALRRWRPHAEVVLERLGPAGDAELELVLALALALAHIEPEQAEQPYERARALVESVFDADDPRRARAHERLGDVALQRGRLDAAADHYEQSLALHAQAFGGEHPSMVGSLHGLARVALRRGEPRKSLELGERALVLADAATTHPSAELIELLLESGELLARLDRLGEARGRLSEALLLGESLLGPTHPLALRARHALEQLHARFAHEASTPTRKPTTRSDEPKAEKKRDWFKKRRPKKKKS